MNPARLILQFSLRAYQLAVSPVLHTLCGPLAGCRHTPSCSAYALDAVRLHGAGRGGWLAFRRLCRCHPWGGAGYDPVPQPRPPRKPGPGQPAAEVAAGVSKPLLFSWTANQS